VKKKQVSVKSRVRKGTEPTPEVICAPTLGNGTEEAGTMEEPIQDEGLIKGSASAKRKRAMKVTKAEQNDGPVSKSRTNSAARIVNQRKLAPAPAPVSAPAPAPVPWVPGMQSAAVAAAHNRNGSLENSTINGVQRQISTPSLRLYQSSDDLTGLPPLPLPSHSFQTPSFNQDQIGHSHGYVSSSHAQQQVTQNIQALHSFQAPSTSSHDQQQLSSFQTSILTSSTHLSPPPSNTGVQFGQPQFTNPFSQTQQHSYVDMDGNNISTRNSHYGAIPQFLSHSPPATTSGMALSPTVSQIMDQGISRFTAVPDFGIENNFIGDSMSDEEFLASFGIFQSEYVGDACNVADKGV